MTRGRRKPSPREEGDKQAEQFFVSNSFKSRPELMVAAKPESGLRVGGDHIKSITGKDVKPLKEALASANAELQPLFGVSEDELLAKADKLARATGEKPPDLSAYYRVRVPEEQVQKLAKDLSGKEFQELLDAAYVRPPSKPAFTVPTSTPDYTSDQGYLEKAPGGIDARYAWDNFPGGYGDDVEIIDIEGAWHFEHEDLRWENPVTMAAGVQYSDLVWRNHGTAVLGILSGDRNPYGITGICPDATVRTIAVFTNFGYESPAVAIFQAAERLRPGDIILLEVHRAGPRYGFGDPPPADDRPGPPGYIPIEWWPDDFAAIRWAYLRDIIVVEAAGNGWEDLDDPIYDANPGFPDWWRNPFRRISGPFCSGAILVGAGVPPPGTHGSDHGPDRSRCEFSNWGQRIDAQGWGLEVTTCGYGDRRPPGYVSEARWYTDGFSGTSSASPMVAGALACVQGILRSHGKPVLTPARARELLRDTGSEQMAAPGRPVTQRIGNRPDLRELIERALESDLAPRRKTEEETPLQQEDKLEVACAEQVTEIIIRCGSPEDMRVLAGGSKPPCVPTCPPSGLPFAIPEMGLGASISLDDAIMDLLRQIQQFTQIEINDLVHQLMTELRAKHFAEAIREYAEKLKIEEAE